MELLLHMNSVSHLFIQEFCSKKTSDAADCVFQRTKLQIRTQYKYRTECKVSLKPLWIPSWSDNTSVQCVLCLCQSKTPLCLAIDQPLCRLWPASVNLWRTSVNSNFTLCAFTSMAHPLEISSGLIQNREHIPDFKLSAAAVLNAIIPGCYYAYSAAVLTACCCVHRSKIRRLTVQDKRC